MNVKSLHLLELWAKAPTLLSQSLLYYLTMSDKVLFTISHTHVASMGIAYSIEDMDF